MHGEGGVEDESRDSMDDFHEKQMAREMNLERRCSVYQSARSYPDTEDIRKQERD